MSSGGGWRQVAQRWWVALFLIAGAGMLAWVLSMVWANVRFSLHGIETEGIVIDVERGSSTVRRKDRERQPSRQVAVDTYVATIEYTDAAGHRIRFVPDIFSGIPVRGARVPVSYMSDRPEEARINRFAENWFRPLFWTPFALLLLLAPSWFLIDECRAAMRKKTKPAEQPAVPNPPRPSGELRDQNAIDKSVARQRRKRGTL